MLESPASDPPIRRFRRELQYNAGNGYFDLRSRSMAHRMLDDVAPISTDHLIACGNSTAAELVTQITTDGTSVLAVADLLDQLYAAGVIEEEVDDSVAWQSSDGMKSRVKGV